MTSRGDRLEVISIGDLHFGLTPEALFREHESKPWNPMIARTFYRRGIIETWGRGTLKIARLMKEAGAEPPRVTVREGAVVVKFAIPQVSEETPVESSGERKTPVETPVESSDERKTPLETRERTSEGVLRLLRLHPESTAVEIGVTLQKSLRAVERAIERLRKAGRLVRVGPKKGGHWEVID